MKKGIKRIGIIRVNNSIENFGEKMMTWIKSGTVNDKGREGINETRRVSSVKKAFKFGFKRDGR